MLSKISFLQTWSDDVFYYTVKKIGTGTREDPIRPDYVGEFVWNPSYKCESCNRYIICIPHEIEETEKMVKVANLEEACESRGLSYSDVLKWFVGD